MRRSRNESDFVTPSEVVDRHNPKPEVRALRDEVAGLNRQLRQYQKEHGQLEALMSDLLEAVPAAPAAPLIYRPDKRVVGTPVDCVLHLSDIHYGAVQQSDEVEGFGEYSPWIAEARLRNLVTDIIDWVTVKRNGYVIPRLHVLLTGDYCSGDIHDELKITNAFPAPVQAVKVGLLLASLLQTLASHFDEVRAHMVTDSNHDRLTRKPQAKEAGLNSYGYIAGEIMRVALREQTNVGLNVIARPWESVECGGRRYLLTHGHHVMGWAGFPYYGIERLVSREALKRMNAADIRKFHRVVLGHWHAPLAHPWYYIGGSVSGTDAFDHGQGRHADPQQVSWMVHPRHGEFDRTEWKLRA